MKTQFDKEYIIANRSFKDINKKVSQLEDIIRKGIDFEIENGNHLDDILHLIVENRSKVIEILNSK